MKFFKKSMSCFLAFALTVTMCSETFSASAFSQQTPIDNSNDSIDYEDPSVGIYDAQDIDADLSSYSFSDYDSNEYDDVLELFSDAYIEQNSVNINSSDYSDKAFVSDDEQTEANFVLVYHPWFTDVTINGYKGNGGDVVIPNSYKNKPIKMINVEAFKNCSTVTSIYMSDTITQLGNGGYGSVFEGCTNLKEIRLSNNINAIWGSTFKNCTSLERLSIPNSVNTIGNYAFQYCESLESINIPNGVTSIGDGAFNVCKSLKKVAIPYNLKEINYAAFANCNALQSVDLGKIEKIGDNAFFNCYSLKGVSFPKSCKQIGYEAFRYCSSLKTIIIPDGISKIGVGAFSNCSDLISVKIGAGIDELPYDLFSECRSLGKIVIPSNVSSIGGSAFKNCISLQEIAINASVKEFGSNVFSGCNSLSDVYYSGSEDDWNNIVNVNNIDLPSGCTIHFGSTGSIIVPEEIEDPSLKLKEAKYIATATQACNLVDNYRTITLAYDPFGLSSKELTLICSTLNNNSEIERYALYQGINLIGTSENGVIKCRLTYDNVGEDYYVIVEGKNGKMFKTLLLLSVNTCENNSDAEVTFGGGNALSVTVPNDVPFIGGGELSFGNAGFPIFITVKEDGTVRFGVNVKKNILDDDDSFFDFRKKWDKALSKPGKSNEKYFDFKDSLADNNKNVGAIYSPDVKINFNVIGYGEAKLYGDGNYPEYININILVKMSVKAEFGWQVWVYVVPVVVELEIEGGAELISNYTWNFKEKSIFPSSGSLDLNPFIKLSVFGGLGMDGLAAVGVTGSAELKFYNHLFSTSDDSGLYKATLTGELGIKAYVLMLEYELPFAKNTWTIYDRNLERANAKNNIHSDLFADIYDINLYSVSDNNYTSKLNNSLSDIIISDAYPASQPSVVAVGDNMLMTFLATDSSRSAINKTVLMYSCYDSNTNTWSAPAKVDNNNTLDGFHKLYNAGNEVYLVYVESDEVLPDYTDLNSFATHLGVTIAKFDTENGQFVDFTRISDKGKYCSRFDFSVVNDAPTVAWVQSSDADVFGQHSNNEIAISRLTNSWGAPEVIKSKLNCIKSIAIGTISCEEVIFYICDNDNNLATYSDATLYNVDSQGSVSEISSGSLSAVRFEELPENTGEAPVWYENGSLVAVFDGHKDVIIENLGETSSYLINGNIIYYIASDDDNKSSIYATIYDSEENRYSLPFKVLSSDLFIQSFDVCNDNIIFSDNYIDTGDNSSDMSYIKMSAINNNYDIQLLYADIDSDSIIPGEMADVTLGIYNDSSLPLTSVHVEYSTNDSTIIYETDSNCEIQQGENKEITSQLKIPDSLTDMVLCVKVTGIKSDTSPDDNIQELDISKTEISVSALSSYRNDNNYLDVIIKNESYVDTTARIEISDLSDNVLFSTELGDITAKNSITSSILCSTLFNSSDGQQKTIKVTVYTNNKEYFNYNNSVYEYVWNKSNEINYVIISFLNADYNLISSQVIKKGDSVTPPQMPYKGEWYDISTGEKIMSYSEITNDMGWVYLLTQSDSRDILGTKISIGTNGEDYKSIADAVTAINKLIKNKTADMAYNFVISDGHVEKSAVTIPKSDIKFAITGGTLTLNAPMITANSDLTLYCAVDAKTKGKTITVKAAADKTVTVYKLDTASPVAFSGTKTSNFVIETDDVVNVASAATANVEIAAGTTLKLTKGTFKPTNLTGAGTLDIYDASTVNLGSIKDTKIILNQYNKVSGKNTTVMLPKLTIGTASGVTIIVNDPTQSMADISGKSVFTLAKISTDSVVPGISIVNKSGANALSPVPYKKDVRAEWTGSLTMTCNGTPTYYSSFEKAIETITANAKTLPTADYVITMNESAEVTKLALPAKAGSLTIYGNGNTLRLTGVTSIAPKYGFALKNINIIAQAKNGNANALTITDTSVGNIEIDGLTFTGKTLTIKGGAKNDLTLGECSAINSLTGFSTTTINAPVEIQKTLTATNLMLGAEADIKINKGATLTVNKVLTGTDGAKITLVDGFKPIALKGTKLDDTIKGDKIKLVSADGTKSDEKQIFATKLDLYGKFDVSGISSDASYDLALQSGKVYLKPFVLEMGGKKYAFWSDIIKLVNARKYGKNEAPEDCTITLLADYNIGAALTLPTNGKYSKLTISGNGHKLTFVGSSVSLTGETTLANITIASVDKKTGAEVKWTLNKNKNTLNKDESVTLLNCDEK